MARGAARQNQRPHANVEHGFGEEAVLNGRLGGPEHTGGQACLHKYSGDKGRIEIAAPRVRLASSS